MNLLSRLTQFKALVQAQTTMLSALPFILGMIFAGFYYHNINWGLSLLLLVAAILFHLAVNGHNQVTDFMRYQNTPDTTESTNNIIKRFNIPLNWAKGVIVILTALAALIGLWLTWLSGWPLLLLGGLSFLVGYAYSGGPLPILKSPFGEIASGLAMGLNITLIGLYINIYNTATFANAFWLKGLIISLPAIFTIANIMLANNICDLAEDQLTGRKTLVYYLGIKASLKLLCANYIFSYLGIILATCLGYLPWLALGSLLTIPPVYQKIKVFVEKPQKTTTFFNNLIALHLILISLLLFSLLGLWL